MKTSIKKIVNKNKFTRELKDSIKFSKEFKKEKQFLVKNHKGTQKGPKQLGYEALMLAHALEKGMSFDNPRPFGKEKVNSIIRELKELSKKEGFKKDPAFVIPFNTLREYAKFYEKMNWIEQPEYRKTKEFISRFSELDEINAGIEVLSKQEIIENSTIDYEKFLKSRHSIRKFSVEKIKEKDIIKAIDAAKLSPSACNRQMIKVYRAESNNADEAIKLAIKPNLSGFDIKTAQPLLITFDAAAFGGVLERNQGWFNAGLFAMNFVNALHSLGIGSCFCEFHLTMKREQELKNALSIPESERIAVVIMAGYYCDKNKVYKSPRIDSLNIYRKR